MVRLPVVEAGRRHLEESTSGGRDRKGDEGGRDRDGDEKASAIEGGEGISRVLRRRGKG